VSVHPTVREATRADAQAIAAMYQETWPVYWSAPEDVRFQFDVVEGAGGAVLVAVEGERVVGHCEFLPVREPAPYGCWGFLEALEVHRGYYRQGIGTALAREAIRRCQALGCERFGTSPDDERSEGLYRRCGMTRIERSICTEFAIVGDLAEPEIDAVEEVEPSARPWERWLHVLGRLSPLAYLWPLTFGRKAAGALGQEHAGAVRVRRGAAEAIVFDAVDWLHVLLPPDRLGDVAMLQAALAVGAARCKASERHSFCTLMPQDLADAVRAVPGIYPSESHFHFHMWMPLERETP
jgi:GNAT superfamily N-acetyltransferase